MIQRGELVRLRVREQEANDGIRSGLHAARRHEDKLAELARDIGGGVGGDQPGLERRDSGNGGLERCGVGTGEILIRRAAEEVDAREAALVLVADVVVEARGAGVGPGEAGVGASVHRRESQGEGVGLGVGDRGGGEESKQGETHGVFKKNGTLSKSTLNKAGERARPTPCGPAKSEGDRRGRIYPALPRVQRVWKFPRAPRVDRCRFRAQPTHQNLKN